MYAPIVPVYSAYILRSERFKRSFPLLQTDFPANLSNFLNYAMIVWKDTGEISQ